MSTRKALATGAVVGAALGTLFALAVVSFADCAGPACGRERVVGVVGHAAGGAALGALLALALVALVHLARWLRRGLARGGRGG